MQITPRYENWPVIEIDGAPNEFLVATLRQHERLVDMLARLDEDQWNAPSRCEGWSVRDVASHLGVVNEFWNLSIEAGKAGTPTRYLSGFDPVATPDAMVQADKETPSRDVYERLVRSSDALCATLTSLDDAQWLMAAEAPPGWLPIRLVAAHATWDSWIHERDMLIPLGERVTEEPDEIEVAVLYAASLSAGFCALRGEQHEALGLRADDLGFTATVVVNDRAVVTRNGATESILRGSGSELAEALSFRQPLPENTPPEWRKVLGGLAEVFNTEV